VRKQFCGDAVIIRAIDFSVKPVDALVRNPT
jgi:hypothetical protein